MAWRKFLVGWGTGVTFLFVAYQNELGAEDACIT